MRCLICLVLAVCLALPVVSGCGNRVELEDIGWVQALGLDKGENGLLVTTMLVGVPQSSGSQAPGGSGNRPPYTTLTVAAKTVLECFQIGSVSIGRRLSLQHNQVFIIGEDLARSDMRATVGVLDRYRETRGSSYIMVARGRAEDVLRVFSSPLEPSPSRFIETLAREHKEFGAFEAMRLGPFVRDLESDARSSSCPLVSLSKDVKKLIEEKQSSEGGSNQSSGGGQQGSDGKQSGGGQQGGGGQQFYPAVPEPGKRMSDLGPTPPTAKDPFGGPSFLKAGEGTRVGGGPIAVAGTAVFSGDTLAGELSVEETRALLMAKGDYERGFFSIPDPQAPDQPQYSFSVELRGEAHDIKVHRSGDKVEVDLHVELASDYLSLKTMTDYTDPRYLPLAEQAVSAYVKQVLDSVILRTQKEMRSDPIGFGSYVRRSFLTWPEWERFAWQSKYPDAEIRTRVDVKIRRFGLDFGPLYVPQSEILEQKQEQREPQEKQQGGQQKGQ